MTLRNAALFALVGTLLVFLVQAVHLIVDIANVARGLAPALGLLTSLLYAFAWLTLVLFFAAFHRKT